VPRRSGRPPGADYFGGLWKPLGYRSAAIDLSGLSINIDGMHETWWSSFLTRYGTYARDTTTDRGAFTLTLSAARDRKEGSMESYIEPPAAGEAEYNPVFIDVEPDAAGGSGFWRVRACTYRLAASFSSAGGRGLAIFSRREMEEIDPTERAVENILRVAIAWLALSRGGLLMHAASIVKDGKAWLFFGQSGSGKSTLSAGTRRGLVVSDDLTLLLPDANGRPEVVGAPFRGTYTDGPPITGRFPVAGAFRLRKAGPTETAAVEPLEPALAMADAIANLPFVVDQLGAQPGLFDGIERVLSGFPIRALRFRKDDDSWWEALSAAPA
jgi:hypothetical protein